MCGGDVGDVYPWPTCSSHYNLATSYTDFYSWVWESLYDPHGPVHIWIGGVMDCEPTYELIGDLVGEEIASALALYSFLHRKNLYRDGFFTCEGTVSIDEKAADVSFCRVFLHVLALYGGLSFVSVVVFIVFIVVVAVVVEHAAAAHGICIIGGTCARSIKGRCPVLMFCSGCTSNVIAF